jgi:hypothetical protein
MNTATFEITGTVKYEPKGIGLKIETMDGRGFKTTHEVLCFSGENNGVKAGDIVTVSGELQSKKSEYVRKYNDKEYPVYLTQLRARHVIVADAKLDVKTDDSDMPF